jgi:hypothetical protein
VSSVRNEVGIYIAEYIILHAHCRESLKSYILVAWFNSLKGVSFLLFC